MYARPHRLLLLFMLLAAACGASADPPAGRTVAINGIDLYYEIHGSGPPLVLIHGGLGHSGYWHQQFDALGQHYQLIALDSRGHGRSGFDAEPIGYRLMTRDVLALLDHLGIARAHILGWSDGGIIGLELAIHHPSRVNKIIAYGANYRPEGVRKDVADNARFNAFIAQAASDYQSISPAPERWQEFLDNIGGMWAREPNYSDEQLRGIAVPMLILGGLEEEAIEIDHIRATAALIPGSKLQFMAGTGHFAMWDKPEEFNRIVLEFLAGAAAP